MTQVEAVRKVTVHVPTGLLEEAQEFTGSGITQTITAGLEKLASSKAYDKLRRLKGSSKNIEIDIEASRMDRAL